MPEIVEHDALLFNVILGPSGRFRRGRIDSTPEGSTVIDPGPYTLSEGYSAAEYYNAPDNLLDTLEEINKITMVKEEYAGDENARAYFTRALGMIETVRAYRRAQT